MTISLLKSKAVCGEFWREPVSTIVYILNIAPIKSIVDKTPYKAYFDLKPRVNQFCVFGCIARVKVLTLHFPKLADQSKPLMFIGYGMNTKGY